MNCYSPRGYLLVCTIPAHELLAPTIAVEFAEKWYNLYVIYPAKVGEVERVEEITFPQPERTPCSTYFVDHVPNPEAVTLWAEERGYEVSELSYELMVGRWRIEVIGDSP